MVVEFGPPMEAPMEAMDMISPPEEALMETMDVASPVEKLLMETIEIIDSREGSNNGCHQSPRAGSIRDSGSR